MLCAIAAALFCLPGRLFQSMNFVKATPEFWLTPEMGLTPATVKVRATFFFSLRRTFFAPAPVRDLGGMSWELSYYFFPAFFLPATVFLGPLRVRALVFVRWPRTGRLRRQRSPS